MRFLFGSGLAVAVIAMVVVASAQEAPPPIDVPTTPVPQGPAPYRPAPAQPPQPVKPPPPAPPTEATAAPAPRPKPTVDRAPDSRSDTKEGKAEEGPKFNNEGVFKISGAPTPVAKPKAGGATGVAPATSQPKSQPKKKWARATTGASAAGAIAEWPGFRMTVDGGSEVMIEFSRPVLPPTEHKAAGTLTYVFNGAHVIKHNNQNPLLTPHFNTPVLNARLAPKKGELDLVIDLRPGVDTSVTTGTRAGSDPGGQQFFVKFPAGSYLPANVNDATLDSQPVTKQPADKPPAEKQSGDKKPKKSKSTSGRSSGAPKSAPATGRPAAGQPGPPQ